MENKIKASSDQIYAVLEQKKRLQEFRLKINSVLDKVNHTLNLLAVENLQLATEIDDDLSDKDEQPDKNIVDIKKEASQSDPLSVIHMNPVEQSNIVNQQLLMDIDVKPYSNEEIDIDSDEELHQL